MPKLQEIPFLIHLLSCVKLRLQDEYIQLQEEMKATIEESKLVSEKYRTKLQQIQHELVSKTTECHELQTQVILFFIQRPSLPVRVIRH